MGYRISNCLCLGSEKVHGLQAKSANHCGGIACMVNSAVPQYTNVKTPMEGNCMQKGSLLVGGIFSCMGFCRTPGTGGGSFSQKIESADPAQLS